MNPPPVRFEALTSAELTLYGQVRGASNLTLVVDARIGDETVRCVYKPVRGERALWDFPDGTLAAREVAAYLIDRALGWDLIPPTVLIERGPAGADLGPGMLQRWIDAPAADTRGLDAVDVVPVDDVPDGWHVVLTFATDDSDPADDNASDDDRDPADDGDPACGAVPRGTMALVHDDSPRLRRLAVLDVVLNNTDRKGGHVLTDPTGVVYGIDHGICVHHEPKLRTVLWGWAGGRIDEETAAALTALAARLGDAGDPLVAELSELITAREIDAVRDRVLGLLESGVMPSPTGQRSLPWPPF